MGGWEWLLSGVEDLETGGGSIDSEGQKKKIGRLSWEMRFVEQDLFRTWEWFISRDFVRGFTWPMI